MRRRRGEAGADPPMTTSRTLLLIGLILTLPAAGCHRRTEAEALEEAREEIRREMQPEVERRQREIDALKRQIAETQARIEAQKSGKQEKQDR